MSTLAFTITGEPKGQPRPRAFARKMGNVHVARFYDSDVADAWKQAVMLAIIKAANAHKWTLTLRPVAVELRFAMPRPKSHSGAKGLKPSAPEFHTQKPDIDNLEKLLGDQITRSGRIWRDDSQIVSMRSDKFWAEGSEQGCWVSILTLGI